jgi:hypothetical protein
MSRVGFAAGANPCRAHRRDFFCREGGNHERSQCEVSIASRVKVPWTGRHLHRGIVNATLVEVRLNLFLPLLILLVSGRTVHAQTYPLRITDRALMNPQVLHARNWPSTLGLPPVAITRTNAGERWYEIEKSRGQFDPNFGNLFTPGTGWVDVAEKNQTDLIYTFSHVPAWAARQEGNRPAKVAPYDIDDQSRRQLHLEGMGHGADAEGLRAHRAPRSPAPRSMPDPQLRSLE